MRITVTGSSGFIGGALVAHLRAAGHDVRTLVRRPPVAAGEVHWDPMAGEVDRAALAGTEAVVHLAGAGVGDHRWTPAYKQEILRSRTEGTRTLVTALGALDPPPRVLVCASAVGVYGDRGDETLTEDSPAGTGFLAGVVTAWEAEAARATADGIRVVSARSGLVMAPHGGAFGRMLTLTRLGAGGPVGGGRQWWSWITLPDEVAALAFLLGAEELAGPVNLTTPAPQRQADVSRAIGRAMHRPSVLPAPGFAVRAVLGEFAGEILASQRVLPARLAAAGFEFRHPDLDAAVAWLTAPAGAHD